MIHRKRFRKTAGSRRLATGLTVGVLAALTMAVALAPAAVAREQRGCPTNAFCIYPQNAGWNNDHPWFVLRPDYQKFASVGHQWWNLKHQVGTHKVFNNASPNSEMWQSVTLNSGLNGAGVGLGAPSRFSAGQSADLDLGEVNSVTVWWGLISSEGWHAELVPGSGETIEVRP